MTRYVSNVSIFQHQYDQYIRITDNCGKDEFFLLQTESKRLPGFRPRVDLTVKRVKENLDRFNHLDPKSIQRYWPTKLIPYINFTDEMYYHGGIAPSMENKENPEMLMCHTFDIEDYDASKMSEIGIDFKIQIDSFKESDNKESFIDKAYGISSQSCQYQVSIIMKDYTPDTNVQVYPIFIKCDTNMVYFLDPYGLPSDIIYIDLNQYAGIPDDNLKDFDWIHVKASRFFTSHSYLHIGRSEFNLARLGYALDEISRFNEVYGISKFIQCNVETDPSRFYGVAVISGDSMMQLIFK